MNIIAGLVLVLIGLTVCFYGWRFFRLIMGLQGFVVGYYVTLELMAAQPARVALIAAGAVGLVGFILFYAVLYKWAFIVFGALFGITLAELSIASLHLNPQLALVAVLVLMLLGAALGALLSDFMIRLSTAFSGAAQTVGGLAATAAALGLTVPWVDPFASRVTIESSVGLITIVLVGGLGVVGFIAQNRRTGSAPAAREKKR